MEQQLMNKPVQDAHQKLLQGYAKWDSVGLLRELAHMKNHEDDKRLSPSIALRKSVITSILKERLNPFQFNSHLRKIEFGKVAFTQEQLDNEELTE